jgi:hypothetical protein
MVTHRGATGFALWSRNARMRSVSFSSAKTTAPSRSRNLHYQSGASEDLERNLALVYAGLGNIDEAFALLASAYEKQEVALAVIKVEPLLDNIRTDSRYLALVKKVGLD